MIHILYALLSRKDYENSLESQLRAFPVQFQQRVLQFRRWQDTQATIYGRLLLKKGLLDYYDLRINWNQITTDKYGRPFFKGIPLDFNITHSGNIVICAISDTKRVGIDIEAINEIDIEDFHDQMTRNELKHIQSHDNPIQAFYEYWTQKEAVLKANGGGLSVPLKSFEVIKNEALLYKDRWYVIRLPIHQEYSCHIASDRPSNYIIAHVEPPELNSPNTSQNE
ncbi:MAG: 4'-phosphopantetheinyl transferase superfamily protein [Bacteroidota bacterium]